MFKNIKIILLYFFLMSCMSSCFLLSHKFKITKEYIKSNHSFYQGFTFSELSVDSIDSAGIPFKYERIKSAVLFINDSKGKQSKKIYFYKPMTNYHWNWRYKYERKLSVMPIQMQKNNWYMIDGLVFFGNPNLSKFIYIDSVGECHSYTKPIITNW